MNLSMRFIDQDNIVYINKSGVDFPLEEDKNLMTPALHSIMDATGGRRGVEIVVEKKIIPGSGIGSSAAAACGAVYAYNILVGSGFSDKELIHFALFGEMMASGARHADNVAPAMMGGIILIRDNDPLDIISIRPPRNLYCVIVHPHIEVKTKDSRAVLPENMPLKSAIRQWANVGAMVAALYNEDYELIGRSLKDLAAEPYRKQFIPQYDSLKETVMNSGALGANISGSGPSVFALCDSISKAKEVKQAMKQHFDNLNIPCDVYSSAISREGCREVR